MLLLDPHKIFMVLMVCGLQLYHTVHKCIHAQVWDCGEVLAYCAQFDDILSGTHACNSNWNLYVKEAAYGINLSLSSPSPHTAFQRVLPETLSSGFCRLLCGGMFISNAFPPYGQVDNSFLHYAGFCVPTNFWLGLICVFRF